MSPSPRLTADPGGMTQYPPLPADQGPKSAPPNALAGIAMTLAPVQDEVDKIQISLARLAQIGGQAVVPALALISQGLSQVIPALLPGGMTPPPIAAPPMPMPGMPGPSEPGQPGQMGGL